MIKRLYLFFVGWVRVEVAGDSFFKCAELFRILAIECTNVKPNKSGKMCFVLTLAQFSKFQKAVKADPFDYNFNGINGLPKLLLFLLHRPGLAIGTLLFVAVTIFSGRIIWNIEIVGNETVSDEAIIGLLDELGCSYGDNYTKIDFDKLHSDFLVKSDEISWISVNMKGTHAQVQVREIRRGGEELPPNTVANVVAGEDAQIMLMKVEAGLGCVSNGDIVKKGELLISGVIPLRVEGVRFEYAKGEVLAYVTRVIEVEIPFKNREKVYTGKKIEKNIIKIFKKSINLSLNYGIEYTTYDKIVESERIYLFGVIPLPVWADKVTFSEYVNSEVVLDVDATVSAAVKELKYKTDEVLNTCEIVNVKQICDVSDTSFSIKQEMLCIANIAETREFTTDLPEDVID